MRHLPELNDFVLLQAEIFQEFTIKEDLMGFQINLTVLLDCLNIFGGSTVAGNNLMELDWKMGTK